MLQVRAPFTVDATDHDDPYLLDAGCRYRRSHLVKTFSGDDLAGSGSVEMLSVQGEDAGAGYVALERIEGRLGGRNGSFALLHLGTLDAGGPSAIWRVVPGSGTGELTGISGSATIEVAADGSHTLQLDYELA